MRYEKGQTPWNKGKKTGPLSEEHRRKIRDVAKGRKYSDATKKKLRKIRLGKKNPFFGKKHSEESRKRMSRAGGGEKSHFWKGGVHPINKIIRGSLEYKLWREAVFARDKWTCVWCGQVGGNLEADHIKPFARYPELRFAIDNGRTLCDPCHKTTDTYGRQKTR